MAERAFVIKRSFLFPKELDASKCEITDGVDGEWSITDNGWVSEPEDLGRLVGGDLGFKDTCVFKFDTSVTRASRNAFYIGLKRTLAKRRT